MLGALALVVLAGAYDAVGLEVVGFSDDGRSFGAVMIPAGATEGALRMVDVQRGSEWTTPRVKVPLKDGKAQLDAALLKSLKLGNDRGEEKFTKGTKVRAAIELGGPLAIEIVPGVTNDDGSIEAEVVIGRGPWCRTRRTIEDPGTDYTLVSVLASRDGKSLAVVLKRTVKGVRYYGFAAARVEENQPWCGVGAKPPTEAQRKTCLAALEKLPAFESTETVTDFEGGAVMPRYAFGAVRVGGELSFSLGEAPAVGALFEGKVGACWQIDQTFTLRLSGAIGGADEVFDVQVVRTSPTEATLASTSSKVEELIPGATFVAARPVRKR